MRGGVTYQGVIPPNSFEKSALNLEIQEQQEESTKKIGESTWSWFSVEGRKMSPDSPPNTTRGAKVVGPTRPGTGAAWDTLFWSLVALWCPPFGCVLRRKSNLPLFFYGIFRETFLNRIFQTTFLNFCTLK